MLWRLWGFPPLLLTWTPKPTRPVAWGMEKKPGFGVYEPLLSGSDLASRVQSTGRKNLWIVPSELDLAAAELELSQQESYLVKLRKCLESLKGNYGLKAILIDCPPTLGLLSMNSLCSGGSFDRNLAVRIFGIGGIGSNSQRHHPIEEFRSKRKVVSGWYRNDHVRQPNPAIL